MRVLGSGSSLLSLLFSVFILSPTTFAQQVTAEGAILEYRADNWGTTLRFLEIDAEQHDAMRPGNGLGRAVRSEFPLAPGRHRVGFVTDGTLDLHPQSLEFDATPGSRYLVELGTRTFKDTSGGSTILCFKCPGPAIYLQQGKKFVSYAVAVGTPFTPHTDTAGNLLLFEDGTVPLDQSARVYSPRKRPGKAPPVFVSRISGEGGATQIDFRGVPEGVRLSPEGYLSVRLLPGSYRFVVTLEGAAWQIAPIQSGKRELTLKAEPGRTYLLLARTGAGDTTVSKDVIGGTHINTTFSWEPYFEDATGPGNEN